METNLGAKSLLSQLITVKYGKGNIENITNIHSDCSWRWRDIISISNVVMTKLFWQVRKGEKIDLTSQFWWKNVSVLPIVTEKIHNLLTTKRARWDRRKLMIVYNTENY